MRRLPSDVSVSLEVKAARGLTRVVFAECRPAFGDRPLYCAEGETPAQALLAFARDCNVPLTLGEAEDVLRDGAACQLWAVEGGVVVICALPPSVVEARKERRAQGRGARGGMSPAEKQARYRSEKAARERAAREASPATGAKVLAFTGGAPLPPTNDSVQVATPGGVGGVEGETLPPSDVDSEPVSPSSLLLRSREEESDAHPGAREGEGSPPSAPVDAWAGLDAVGVGRTVVQALSSLPPTVWQGTTATREELAGLGDVVRSQHAPVSREELASWAAFLASPGALLRAFAWSPGIKAGTEVLTVPALLGAKNGELFKGSGLRALRTHAATWAAQRAKVNAAPASVQALRAVPMGRPARAEDLAAVREAIKRGEVQ